MAIRLVILYILVAVLSCVALRRWYWSLCGLLFMTVLTQNPSMPTKMGNIQGLNPWNFTFIVIAFAWLLDRHRDPHRAKTPLKPVALLLFYVAMLCTIGLIAALDKRGFRGDYADQFSGKEILIETIINPLKYLFVGVMFYDGALSRNRVKMALFSAVGSGLCYSLLMFKTLREKVFTIDYTAARRATDKLIGLFANDMAEITAFSILAAFVIVVLIKRDWLRALWLTMPLAAIPAFLALKSRAGFLAICAAGATIGVLRHRKLLLLLPVAVVLIIAIEPSVGERVLQGVGQSSDQNDWNEISAGRTTYLWPAAIEQIQRSPFLGHGRYAVLRTDCYDRMIDLGAHGVPQHPHSAYLEILIDAGAVGLLICLMCFAGLAAASWRLLRIQNDPLISAVGVVGLIALTTELTAAVAGSSFYPTQSAVPYLCVWGVAMRVAVEQRSHAYKLAYASAPANVPHATARPVMAEQVPST